MARVRIAVALRADGEWHAVGWKGAKDADLRDSVMDIVYMDEAPDQPTQVSYVTAHIPDPLERTIKGYVTPDTDGEGADGG